MDKITRILRLYAQLAQGKKVNKANFCIETGCMERSFDRDIEDIRLYLADFFCGQELVYDRTENAYYFTNSGRYILEPEEYLFIERVLVDSDLLIPAEMQELLLHIASNTTRPGMLEKHCRELCLPDKESLVKENTLKMFYDMQRVIDGKKVIRFLYEGDDGKTLEHEVIPYRLAYEDGIIKVITESKTFDLKKINSFCIVGNADRARQYNLK